MEKLYKNRFPFFEILCLIFITLKLMDYIDWSWWAVLSPLWVCFLLSIVVSFFKGMYIGYLQHKNNRSI
jgi:hypothetical protein